LLELREIRLATSGEVNRTRLKLDVERGFWPQTNPTPPQGEKWGTDLVRIPLQQVNGTT